MHSNLSADLSNITASEGSLSPPFDSGTTSYNIDVENSISSIEITGIPDDISASVAYSYVNPVSLSVGANPATITCTAADGITIKNYVVTINRAPPWYNTNWNYRKKITIDYTRVEAVLANFPLLINIASNDDLRDYTRADGFDILFTDDSSSTKLDHEIEKFESATGELIAWVRIPALSDTSNTELYLYFGNPVSADQSNANDVWDTNYKMVQHMNEDPSLLSPQMKDSTQYNNDCTSNGGMLSEDLVFAAIGDGIDFEGSGSSQYLNCSNASSLDITENLTIELWVNIDLEQPFDYFPTLIGKGDENTDGWRLYQNDLSDTCEFAYVDNLTNSHYILDTSTTNILDTWQHLVIRRDFTNTNASLYLNGVEITTSVDILEMYSNSESLFIGDEFDGGYFDGIIDEVRISDSARSAEWIITSYNNQSSPDTFYSHGATESVP